MKKTVIFILMLISVNLSAQKTVVDYYRLLPDSIKYGYELNYKAGKWISNSSADYEIYPIVDIRNGYIHITDDGTGGGTNDLVVVLYRKPDGSALIATSFSNFDGMFFECSHNFLEYENNKWKKIDDEVLPEISAKLFMNENYSVPDIINHEYSIYFDLPQHGTTVNLILKYTLLRMYCSGAFSNTNPDKEKVACDFVKNVKTDTIPLFWNKKMVKFELKKR